jgi:hypothetical protein
MFWDGRHYVAILWSGINSAVIHCYFLGYPPLYSYYNYLLWRPLYRYFNDLQSRPHNKIKFD